MRDGSQWRPMVHVKDTAAAQIFMLDAPAERVNGEIFNVGSAANVYQLGPLAEIVAAEVPRDVEIEFYGDVDHRSYRVGFDKIEALGWRATREAADGVREICAAIDAGLEKDERTITLAWYRPSRGAARPGGGPRAARGDAPAMRLLVLGSAGQLGGDLIDAAAAAGVPAQGVGRAEVDVTDRDALRAFLAAAEFDVLVNATSYHKTDEVEGNPALAMDVNAHAPAAMAEACAREGRALPARLDRLCLRRRRGRAAPPLLETDPPAPVNVYGLSKLFGETLSGLAGADVTVFRVASLFGVRGASGKGGNFVETMIRFGREKGALKVVNDQVMSPTSTAFIARAILAFLGGGGAPGVYHCVNSGAVSWHGFAEAIVRQAGVKATVAGCSTAEWPTVARRPAWSALDNGKLAGGHRPDPGLGERARRLSRRQGLPLSAAPESCQAGPAP